MQKAMKKDSENLDIQVNVNLILERFDRNGKRNGKWAYHNISTTTGKNEAIKQIVGAQPAAFNYVGIGTGTTSETAGDTTLETEVGTRVQDTSPDYPSTGRGDIIVVFAAGNGTGTITEAGLFNASTSGTMLARKTFTAKVKAADETLRVTWQITVA